MKLRDLIPFSRGSAPQTRQEPRFVRAQDGGVLIDSLTDGVLEEYLRGGMANTHSGAHVTPKTSLILGVAWRCANIICGVTKSLPWDLMIREGENGRKAAEGNPFRDVLTVRPNNRQTPSEFRAMLQLHKLQAGDGFAMKIVSRGRIIALWPLDPMRMTVIENADLSLTYRYVRLNGGQVDFTADQILHLRGPSWDGVRGLPIARFMAESIGMGIQTQKAAAKLFKNGQFRPGYIQGDQRMSDAAFTRLQESLDEVGGVDSDAAGKIGILEEGFKFQATSLSAADAQLIQLMGFNRTDVGMFYGVPPHLYGDVSNSTSWGTGIEQQNIGFLQYTINPHLTDWRDTIKRDCLSNKGDDPNLYVHIDLKGFLAADANTRAGYYARALGGGGSRPWMKQNEVRAAEDLPPATEPWANQLPEIGAGRITETVNDPTVQPSPPPG